VIRILRAADRVAVPWKNGGGVTREVAIWPKESSFDNFDWRISIAEVRSSGPFSVFDNIDRTMCILHGRLTLAFGERVMALDTNSAPFAFPGDVACSGTPLDGDVMDLNVMTRRGRCLAHVEGLPALSHFVDANRTLIVASAPSMVAAGAEPISLEALDALLIEGSAAVHLHSGAGFKIALSGR
jgi:environmental stress-induced protein Ves